MTEFALVLPILVILLFGVIQFGIVFNNYITVTDAVRAGARKGAVGRHLQNPECGGRSERPRRCDRPEAVRPERLGRFVLATRREP